MVQDESEDRNPDRHWLLRQALRALLCIGVIALIVGVVSRHTLLGVLGAADMVVMITVLLRLPAPDEKDAPEVIP